MMTRSAADRCYMTHLECSRCGKSCDPDQVRQVCVCGGPLLVRYDLEALGRGVTRREVAAREPTLWRYREFLPLRDHARRVSMGEGMTPIVRLPRTGQAVGLENLMLKDESLLPTGTFKTRGAAVGVSRALELGVRVLAMPTNGNAGGAWAAYAARAGIEAVIVMPEDAPVMPRNECAICGASLYLVRGLISDAGRIVARAIEEHGWYDASTLKEPYRIEGKKTMGMEIFEQLAWRVPDVILYPTGGGVGIIGIYKALLELQAIGWLDGRRPRLVAVQSSGCAPVVRAWEAGEAESLFWENSKTVAFGINVPKALGDFLVLEAIAKTGGCAVAVDDGEILDAQKRLAADEGMFVCPEGAATLAAAATLARRGWIDPSENVLLLNTGAGLKYPETVDTAPPVLDPGDSLPAR